MSYRPQGQSLEDPILSILNGIEEFKKAADERIKAGTSEWKESHLSELTNLKNKLNDIQLQLSILNEETW